HGDRAQQDPEGLRREVALDARPQCRVRARVGLPRTAHRAPGRQGARPRQRVRRCAPGHGPRREDPALPGVRAEVHRHPARGVQAPRGVRGLEASVRASLVIWTTTPWTLPANLAIAVHPGEQYTTVEVDGEALVVARALTGAFLQLEGVRGRGAVTSVEVSGAELAGTVCRHPWIDRD